MADYYGYSEQPLKHRFITPQSTIVNQSPTNENEVSDSGGESDRNENDISRDSPSRNHLSTNSPSINSPTKSPPTKSPPSTNSPTKSPPSTNSPTKKPLSINSSLKMVIIVVILCVISVILYNFPRGNCPNTCSMAVAENRDFDRYYGINGLKNHFTSPTADECNANVIFKSNLPPGILKSDNSSSSFLTLAKYGTGKTLLRCEYYKSLESDKYLKMSIFNKEISEYIERFVGINLKNDNDCTNTNCLHAWSENEFAQLLLSTLVTTFINTYEKEPIELQDISLEEKFELIHIICYYYNNPGTSKLEDFINYFLNKSESSLYKAQEAIVQIQERNVAQDKPLLIHFKNDLGSLSVLQQDPRRLYLLLSVVEGEGFQHKAIVKSMHKSIFNDLTHFSLFIKKHMNKNPVFIIDGIDENRFFFHKNSVNKDSFESFCRSSLSQQILSKVMANDFYLSIFYPKIDGINIQDYIARKDKFPIYGIDWNTKSLINYADYALQSMDKDASPCRCKSLKDIKTLVNYSNKRVEEIMNKISTPRALHYFMIKLISEMNNNANDVRTPFIATFENVHDAYEKSYEYGSKIIQIK